MKVKTTLSFFVTLILLTATGSTAAHADTTEPETAPAFSSTQLDDENTTAANLPTTIATILTEAQSAPHERKLHETGGILWTLVPESDLDTSNTPAIQPYFSVGVGWYLYIYLTPNDWNFLTSAGARAVSSAMCSLAGGGPVGGVACGTLGSIIGSYIGSKTGPKGNQCAEIKLRVGTNPVGYKIFNKTCAAMGK
ncbi:MAG: hypothetical protein SPI12_06410 [Actinomycetaceae bacterium]|nr:hypothetical protein [Actinomycetaceae bacterium]MDY6083470.1 hypothetical protein [Actinomycetaceae bacterium]